VFVQWEEEEESVGAISICRPLVLFFFLLYNSFCSCGLLCWARSGKSVPLNAMPSQAVLTSQSIKPLVCTEQKLLLLPNSASLADTLQWICVGVVHWHMWSISIQALPLISTISACISIYLNHQEHRRALHDRCCITACLPGKVTLTVTRHLSAHDTIIRVMQRRGYIWLQHGRTASCGFLPPPSSGAWRSESIAAPVRHMHGPPSSASEIREAIQRVR
jgi:hypothetical protein